MVFSIFVCFNHTRWWFFYFIFLIKFSSCSIPKYIVWLLPFPRERVGQNGDNTQNINFLIYFRSILIGIFFNYFWNSLPASFKQIWLNSYGFRNNGTQKGPTPKTITFTSFIFELLWDLSLKYFNRFVVPHSVSGLWERKWNQYSFPSPISIDPCKN